MSLRKPCFSAGAGASGAATGGGCDGSAGDAPAGAACRAAGVVGPAGAVGVTATGGWLVWASATLAVAATSAAAKRQRTAADLAAGRPLVNRHLVKLSLLGVTATPSWPISRGPLAGPPAVSNSQAHNGFWRPN